MMTKILLTGKNGQVGWELLRTLTPLGHIVAVDRDDVDLTNLASLREYLRCLDSLALIVNPAAYTAVDQAEDEPTIAKAVNTDAAALLAEESNRLGIPMIHYSTDYIFDGTKETPYFETDIASPLGVYGQTKWDGEIAVSYLNPRHLILRLCWVYGNRGRNFFLTMLRLAKQQITPRVVCDQFGSPTWCRMVAEATALIAAQILRNPHNDNRWGTYHLAATNSTHWHEFASAIFRFANEKYSLDNPLPTAILSSEYPTKAQRPNFSHLSVEKVAETFGVRLPGWREQLKLVCEECPWLSPENNSPFFPFPIPEKRS